MKIIDLTKQSEERPVRERVLKIAKTLTSGQGVSITEVAKELGCDPATVRNAAKSIGCYVIKYNKGRPSAFLTAPPK